MARIFTMPELAESVIEGEITQWFVAEGDPVTVDQPLLEVMTDKVTVEIPSPYTGVLVEQVAKEGAVVAVGEPVARFDAGSAEVTAPAGGSRDASSPSREGGEGADDGSALTLFRASEVTDDEELPLLRRALTGSTSNAGSVNPVSSNPASTSVASTNQGTGSGRGPYGRPLAVPAARRKAREAGIPLHDVPGSGPAGRIRVADVESVIKARSLTPRRSVGMEVAPELEGEGTTRIPMRGMRRAIARHMMDSHLGTARALLVDEADVGALVDLRQRLKERAAVRGVRLSFLPFILTALTRALADFPMLNARYDATDESIVRHHHVHAGLAVATEGGLVVPVVRHAQARGLLDLAQEVARLADAARNGTLTPEDVAGGTFTVTSIGSIGGLFSLPVLNAPEAAILGVHAIKKRPVVLDDDSIVARPMLYLSLAFDHRMADGAEVAHFMNRLIALLEDPEALLLGT